MNKGLLGKVKIPVAVFSVILVSFFVINFVLPSVAYSGSYNCTTTGAFNMCTDYEDYAPTEVVTVTGSGFDGYSSLLMKVIRPDGSSST